MSTKSNDSTTFDPSRRRLCPDGSCVGLLGSDGRCKVCRSLGSGVTGETPAADPPTPPTPQPEPSETDDEATSETPSEAEAAFNPNRRLCPDEACIGVIGSDSKCSVCGRRG